jgi:CHAD domain-containing protein
MTPKDFRIGPQKELGTEMKRLLSLQLQCIRRYCLTPLKSSEKNIHEIRKAIKRSRAVLKLMRDSMGYAGYYRENHLLQEHHRLFGAARELHVLRNTMKGIDERYSGLFSEAVYDEVLDLIQENLEAEKNRLKRTAVLERLAASLEEPLSRIDYYHVEEEGFEVVRRGLERIYSQGRSSLHAAFSEHATMMQLHEFRKKGKYLYYQLELLRPAFPRVIKAYARTMEQLTDLLGACHDLHRARMTIPELFNGRRAPRRSLAPLFTLFEEEQVRMKREARTYSENMFVEGPQQFVSRVQTFWENYIEADH